VLKRIVFRETSKLNGKACMNSKMQPIEYLS